MSREIYDEDHEAFRASVKEFLDREVVPHLDEYAESHGLSREFWLAAGKQGFLGLEIPEAFGGSEAGDYRFNAVLTEELAKVNMTLPSLRRHPRRHHRALPRAPNRCSAVLTKTYLPPPGRTRARSRLSNALSEARPPLAAASAIATSRIAA